MDKFLDTSFNWVDPDTQTGLTPGMKLRCVCARSLSSRTGVPTSSPPVAPVQGKDPLELLAVGCYVDSRTGHSLDRPGQQSPGWAQDRGYCLQPPAELLALRTEAEWAEVKRRISELPQDQALTEELSKNQPLITPHTFKEGMKLEAVDPAAPISIRPATVTKVYNEQYFLVTMDDLCGIEDSENPGRSFLCHKDSPGIFPAQWSLKNSLTLCPHQGADFDWADYLKQCGAEAAPQNCFPAHVHVATVTRVKGQYMWLGLEGLKTPMPELIIHVDSLDIFPVSWCETNGYPLVHPIKPPVEKERKIAVVQPEKHRIQPKSSSPDDVKPPIASQSEAGPGNGKYCCPKIYFNHRCFSGPYLNKGRIAELPQFIGPGNCILVLKEVLTLLINSAYKPSRVLRELQLDQESRWQGHGETLKAKYKGKSYRATVEIVRTADRVADFCRKTCIKLECCPNLFGPRMVLERCSENCSVLTKTKYTYYYGKKKSKRVGRPPGGHSNLEGGVKRRGRRRKRRKQLFVHKKRRSSASVDNTPAGSPQLSRSEPPQKLCLSSSPLEWTVTDVVRFIKTTDCAPLARIFMDQDIDGQALLLLNLPTVQECMDLKLGPAIKLCYHIERLKLAFYQQFATGTPEADRPPEGRPPEGRPPEADLQRADLQRADLQRADLQSSQGRPPEGRPPEGRPPEGRPPEGRPPEADLQRADLRKQEERDKRSSRDRPETVKGRDTAAALFGQEPA
ncbi:hypothetical protein WMY93_011193 [Mugilogobius chulae]|uniref:SAM domain-containing protein n=1 Tax=Mugilogobius chulae TaxID=88201 RepID=A0AAW0P196_9GOBI